MAAKTIGFSFILDGLDGRVARMTNTTSEFGKELDSLADIISFGIAPAILAYVWGVQFAPADWGHMGLDQLQRAGKLISFLFLVCGAAPTGAVQHYEKSCASQSGQAGPEILRGSADSGRGRHGGRR